MKWITAVVLCFSAAAAVAEPLRVGRIRIEATSLFSDDELRRGTLYRVLNHLHTPTHEDLVRRVLLVHEGDLFDPMLLAESEKNLRRLDFIKTATISAGEPHDGVVDVTVHTQDQWTTDPNVDLGRGGGIGTWSVNVTQKDLFGTGAEVSVTDARHAERTTRTLEVLDPVFIRPYWNLETLVGRNSDGGEKKLLLEQPFYSQTATSSFSILLDDRTLDERLFASGVAVARFHAHKDDIQALFGRALTTGDSGSQRLFAGYESNGAAFAPVALRMFAPAGHRDGFFVFGYGFTRTLPLKLDYVDHDAKFDDFLTGIDASLFAGVGREVEELRASASSGVALGSRGLLLSKLTFTTRLRAGTENEIATGDVRLVWKFDTARPAAFVSRLRVDDGRHLDGDVQFYADELRGLRGYPTFSFAGARSFVFNAEQRFFLGRELMQLFAPGFAVFVDSGDAVSRGSMHPHTDVGAGLRFSLNRADSTVLRIDLSHALDPSPHGQRRWALSIGTTQAF